MQQAPVIILSGQMTRVFDLSFPQDPDALFSVTVLEIEISLIRSRQGFSDAASDVDSRRRDDRPFLILVDIHDSFEWMGSFLLFFNILLLLMKDQIYN